MKSSFTSPRSKNGARIWRRDNLIAYLFATQTRLRRGLGTKGTFHDRHSLVDLIGQQSKTDLYLLTAPDVPFVQDGFRDGQYIRNWMNDRFEEQLTNLSQRDPAVRIVQIHGSYEQRLAIAIASVDRMLSALPD